MTFSNLHVVTHSILPREQEAACSSAGGGAELAIAGCPALELAGDLTHDGPEHEAMSLFCDKNSFPSDFCLFFLFEFSRNASLRTNLFTLLPVCRLRGLQNIISDLHPGDQILEAIVCLEITDHIADNIGEEDACNSEEDDGLGHHLC